MLGKGAQSVLLTLGEMGSLYMDQEQTTVVPAEKVTAKDTSGAGDAYIGGLAYALVAHVSSSFERQLEIAGHVAARSVMRLGTQSSYPTIAELNL